jgi:hypothetical protein
MPPVVNSWQPATDNEVNILLQCFSIDCKLLSVTTPEPIQRYLVLQLELPAMLKPDNLVNFFTRISTDSSDRTVVPPRFK